MDAIVGGASEPFPDPLTFRLSSQPATGAQPGRPERRLGVAEQLVELRGDLPLEGGLERRQQPPEADIEHDLSLPTLMCPVTPGRSNSMRSPFHVVVEAEALVEVLGDLLGDVLRLFMRQLRACGRSRSWPSVLPPFGSIAIVWHSRGRSPS